MHEQEDVYDVIIVGAGPVGLSLANKLAQAPYKVLVLEKNMAIAEHSRAPVIWPATQEILSQLQVINIFLEKGMQFPELCIWDADKERVLLTAPIKALRKETSYAQLLILPQPETEAILLQALKKYTNVTVLFSSEAVDLVQAADKVKLTYKCSDGKCLASAAIVVGADGAHSFVREKIDASLSGKTYPIKVALADVVLREEKKLTCFRLSSGDGIAVAVPIKMNTWRLIFPLRKKTNMPLSVLLASAVNRLFGTNAYECIWMSDFHIHNRLSTSFCKGRVVLAGDAAHLNSPVGGQGMNSGIQDILSLSEAIDKSLKNKDTAALINYSKQRQKKVRKGVNSFTDLLTKAFLLFADGRLIKPVFRLLNFLLHVPWIRMKILRRIAMLR